jgi:hypothetical protein
MRGDMSRQRAASARARRAAGAAALRSQRQYGAQKALVLYVHEARCCAAAIYSRGASIADDMRVFIFQRRHFDETFIFAHALIPQTSAPRLL